MRTVVLGRLGMERARVERAIVDAGHTLQACHDRSWGCVGMDDACPLDDDTIDVAVAVAEPGGRFDPQGIACAFRARIPIVAVGGTDADPVLEYVVANIAHGDPALVEAVAAAATDVTGHRAAIERAVLAHRRPDETIHVSVERTARSIDVLLVARADAARAAALADVARSAAREFDDHVAVIDVSVVEPD